MVKLPWAGNSASGAREVIDEWLKERHLNPLEDRGSGLHGASFSHEGRKIEVAFSEHTKDTFGVVVLIYRVGRIPREHPAPLFRRLLTLGQCAGSYGIAESTNTIEVKVSRLAKDLSRDQFNTLVAMFLFKLQAEVEQLKRDFAIEPAA